MIPIFYLKKILMRNLMTTSGGLKGSRLSLQQGGIL